MEVEYDGQKKRKTIKSTKSKEEVSETETETETDEYEPTDSEGSISGETTGEESEAEVIVQKKKKASLKRKRENSDKKTEVAEQKKTSHNSRKKSKKDDVVEKKSDGKKSDEKNEQPLPNEGENEFQLVVDDEVKKTTPSPTKKVAVLFDSGMVDFNLDTENPNNIVPKTVKISTGLKLTCKMLAGATMSSGKVTYPDWAALIFQKKIKDEKCFEFNLSLKDAPKIVEGLKFLIGENKKFFNSV